MDARASDQTQCLALPAAPVSQEADTSEAEDHHGPGRCSGTGATLPVKRTASIG
jgi:hypothetical protein